MNIKWFPNFITSGCFKCLWEELNVFHLVQENWEQGFVGWRVVDQVVQIMACKEVFLFRRHLIGEKVAERGGNDQDNEI